MSEQCLRVICLAQISLPDKGMASANRMLHLMRMIQNQGCEATVLTPISDSGQRGEFSVDGVRVLDLCGYTLKDMSNKLLRELVIVPLYYFRAMKYIRKMNRDGLVVYCYSAGWTFVTWAFFLALVFRCPFVKEINEFPVSLFGGGNFLSKFVEAHLFTKYYDAGVFMTKPLVDYYVPLCRKNFKHVEIPMTVDWRSFSSAKGCPFDFDYIAYIGNMNRIGGGVDILVRVYDEVSKKYGNLHLVLIGNGSEQLKDKYRQLLNSDAYRRTHFLFGGDVSREDIPRYVRGAKILAMLPLATKQQEGCFPTKLGEYLSSGVPTVVSRVGNPAIALKDTEAVYFVEPNDVRGTVGAISRILDDYDRALSVAKRGQEFARSHFYFANHAGKLVEWLRSLCSREEG